MSDNISFGAWLRRQRRSRDLTQIELAKLVGCAVGTLRNLEADDARPSKQLAERLAHVLGVSEAEIPALIVFARGGAPRADGPVLPIDQPKAPAAPVAPARHRTHMPAQMTNLIGRAHEIDQVRALLLRPDVRLVTLSGPGGTGKTRVAVASAVQMADAFPDGVAFVDLAALSDPDLVLTVIAQNLGVADNGSQPLRVQLAAALHAQTLLLLLDNFEHVVAAAAPVAALLVACPRLKLLVTSRIALGITGEYERPIPPLELPDRAQLPPIAQLSQYEAVRLFDERARAARPPFAITSSNAPAVAEICHQLDGLPLAIELVAAWVKLFEPHALLARLDHRLTFLTGGRNRPTRQQTMANTIAWSYDLLAPNEQMLFQRLSVFVGGGTLSALCTVCGELAHADDPAVLAGVAALVNQSLLRTLPAASSAAGAAPRFGMFETIRAYALEQFAAAPDAEQIRRRHAQYYVALAEHAAAEWSTPLVDHWINQLHRDHDNIRAALHWARDSGNAIIGLQLAGALWRFWQGYGYTSEGRAWLDRLLTLNDPHPDATTMVARLSGLQAAAWLASSQHDDAQVAQLLEQSMLLRRRLRETTGETNPLVNVARQARTVGHYAQAATALETALARHAALRDRLRHGSADLGLALYDLGMVLRVLGLVRREQGHYAQSAALFEEALAMQRVFGDREGVALSLIGLADVARDQGDAPAARIYGEESLAILRSVPIPWMIGFALNTLAQAAFVAGDHPQAASLIAESVVLFRELNAYSSLAEVLITQGQIMDAQNDARAAESVLTEALRYAWAVGPRLFVAAAMEALASISDARAQPQRAIQLLATASVIRAQMGTPVRPVDQARIAATRRAAHTTLGADTVAALWGEAETLPVAQVLALLTSFAPAVL